MARRWKEYSNAHSDEERESALSNKSGGHNRAFSEEESKLLKEQVLALPVSTYESVRTTALALKHGISIARNE